MTAIAEETIQKEKPAAARPAATPVSGIADLGDGRGFLRTAGYRRSGGDIPITPAQVRQYGLRPGDHIEGTAGSRQNKDLLAVESVNGLPPAEARNRPRFDDLTPVYPSQRFRLEDGDPSRTARIIDLVSPIGKGQRGLIVAPPKAGKTTVLKTIARAIGAAYPEVHVMLVLVGERPEEVTDLRRTVRGEVIASTFDQSPADHIKAAELAIERAKRLAELGRDVVVMLDSLFEEFKGTGNMELRLRRDLAEKWLFPAIDPGPSGTRREDLLMDPAEHAAVVSLRRALAALDSQHALELLLDKTAAPNEQFLRQVGAAR